MAVAVRSLAIAIVLSAAPAGLVRAQPGLTPPGAVPPAPANPPQVRHQQRRTFFLGGGVGFGLREDGGFAGAVTAGFASTRSLAIVGDLSFLASRCSEEYEGDLVSSSCSDDLISLVVLGGGLRWSLSERWWTQGTVGFGFMDHTQLGEDSGMGWTLGTGFDLYHGSRVSIDGRMNLLGGFFEDVGPVRATLGVGLTLY